MIEEIYRDLCWPSGKQDEYVSEINKFFLEQNIGWQLHAVPVEDIGLLAPEIIIRGTDAFENAASAAMEKLEAAGRESAKHELKEALHDLSRRPEPDLTGAVHHAIAALECVTAEVCGETGKTLGHIVSLHPNRFPPPLGEAVKKMYGFASEQGRHVTEGKTPSQKEVELIVNMSAALVTFLLE